VINIRDALDFLERAKSSAENIERYAYDCDFGEARLVILELIAEVERLRSHHIQIMGKIRAWILNDCAEVCRGFDWRDEEISRQREEIAAKDARIKELEAERDYWRELFQTIQGDRDILTTQNLYIERLEAAFLDMYPLFAGATDEQAREALERIKEGGKDMPS